MLNKNAPTSKNTTIMLCYARFYAVALSGSSRQSFVVTWPKIPRADPEVVFKGAAESYFGCITDLCRDFSHGKGFELQ